MFGIWWMGIAWVAGKLLYEYRLSLVRIRGDLLIPAHTSDNFALSLNSLGVHIKIHYDIFMYVTLVPSST